VELAEKLAASAMSLIISRPEYIDIKLLQWD